jgi:predicted ABC-type ATPase
MADKTLYIIGGPNGAGKTTFAGKLLASTGLEYIGADKIAAELCPENPASFQLEAGRMFLE